jgi:hypothetical protein
VDIIISFFKTADPMVGPLCERPSYEQARQAQPPGRANAPVSRQREQRIDTPCFFRENRFASSDVSAVSR